MQQRLNSEELKFSISFWYKTIFALHRTTVKHKQSNVEFYDESYHTKNLLWNHFMYQKLEKVEKSGLFENFRKNFNIFQQDKMCFIVLISPKNCISTQ